MDRTTFLEDEGGAVTVDWVVLTAALVGLGLAVMSVVSEGVRALSEDIGTQLSSDGIIRTSFSDGSVSFEAAAAALGVDVSGEIAALRGLSNQELAGLIASTSATAASSAEDLSSFDTAYAAFQDAGGFTREIAVPMGPPISVPMPFGYGGVVYVNAREANAERTILSQTADYDSSRAEAYSNEGTERGL